MLESPKAYSMLLLFTLLQSRRSSPLGLPDAQDMRCASYQQVKGFTYGANGHSICRMPTLAASVSQSSRSTSRAWRKEATALPGRLSDSAFPLAEADSGESLALFA